MTRYLWSIVIIGILSCSTAYVMAQEEDDEGRQLIQVPYTYSTPTIDGVLSPGEWDGAASNTVDWDTIGVSSSGGAHLQDDLEDISYTFSVMYDDLFVYFGVSVKDDVYIAENYGHLRLWDLPVTWENDAVEYFFDGDASRSLGGCRTPEETATGGQWIYGLGADDTALPFVTAGQQGGWSRPYGTGPDDVWYAQTTVDEQTADWYQEARFALSIIGTPVAGTVIGFNIAVDDVDVFDELTLTEPDYLPGLRDMQLYWTSYDYFPGEEGPDPCQAEDQWGTMRFLEPVSVKDWQLY